MLSGQTFRWSRHASGAWVGAIGQYGFAIREDIKRHIRVLEVESNATAQDFANLFRLERSPLTLLDFAETLSDSGRSVFARQLGLRLMRPPAPEEVIFSFLCSANNHLARIRSMVQHLASWGPLIPGLEAYGLRSFPSAATIASRSSQELREAKFGYRSERIIEVARILCLVNMSVLQRLPTPELRQELMTWPGVGPKVADCILLYAFDRTDVVPFDVHMWRAYGQVFNGAMGDQSLTAKRGEQAASDMVARFGDWAGWAQLWLYYDALSEGRLSQPGQ